MLDRIALHQTRLRTPGLSLDSKGVALGARGLVLLPSLERLVGLLSLYTASASLAEILGSLSIDVVRSKLGGREVVVGLAAEGSDRMDRVAELGRLSGGYTFTGTNRHYVQYRDAAAPFGYDVREISPSDAPIVLYHTEFSQHYQPERKISLPALLLKLQPRPAPAMLRQGGARWICAEAGLGAALIHYFVRSRVPAMVGVAEWPPASEFEERPLRRYLFRLDALPERMSELMLKTPGIEVYAPTGPGSAVELGYEHPINLRACPVFPADGLVMIRGGGRAPISVATLPTMGPVSAFARVEMGAHDEGAAGHAARVESIALPLRLALDTDPWRQVTATRVAQADLGLLRQLVYRLGHATLRQTRVAFTPHGALLLRREGIEQIPVGEFFRQIHPQLFVSAGYAPVPAVAPEVLHQAFGSPTSELIFIHRDGTRLGVPESAFVPLEQALLDAQSWSGTTTESVVATLTEAPVTVLLDPVGFRPMRDVGPAGGG